MFYFTISNIPIAIRTCLENMYTFAVIQSSSLSYLSHEIFDKIFLYYWERKLTSWSRDGNVPFIVQGTLIAVCGDTKGLHQMFGLYLCQLFLWSMFDRKVRNR